MTPPATDHSLRAIGRIRDVFSGVLSLVEEWASTVEGAVAERGSDGITLDEVVAAAVHGALTEPTRLVSGAGFVSTPEETDEPWHVSWWVAPSDGRVGDPIARRSITENVGQATRRYTRMEWWRSSVSTGRRHLVGPYIDYPGSGTSALTATAPVRSEERIIGIMAADVPISRLERVVSPVLDSLGPDATIVNVHGRVILSADPTLSTGDLLRTADGSPAKSGPERALEGREVHSDEPAGIAIVL